MFLYLSIWYLKKKNNCFDQRSFMRVFCDASFCEVKNWLYIKNFSWIKFCELPRKNTRYIAEQQSFANDQILKICGNILSHVTLIC